MGEGKKQTNKQTKLWALLLHFVANLKDTHHATQFILSSFLYNNKRTTRKFQGQEKKPNKERNKVVSILLLHIVANYKDTHHATWKAKRKPLTAHDFFIWWACMQLDSYRLFRLLHSRSPTILAVMRNVYRWCNGCHAIITMHPNTHIYMNPRSNK